MTFDAHANFAYTLVATAPSPASSGTSLVVTAGAGALFPAVPFNAVIWATGANPVATNAEIVRVTAITTDTLTIVRAQEGSSARSVIVGDQIAAAVTAKTLTDIEASAPGLATNALVLGTAAAAGAATTAFRSDDTIAAFDATVPSSQAFGDAAATGSVAKAARRDHKHAMMTNPTAGYGTVVTKNTGTSGNTVPLLDGANTWSAKQQVNAQIAQSVTDGATASFVATSISFTDNRSSALGGIPQAVGVNYTDSSTGNRLSGQAMRLGFVKSAGSTGVPTAADIGLNINSTFNADAAYTFYALFMDGPIIASGKTLTTFTGLNIAAPSGAGTVTNQNAIITAAGLAVNFNGGTTLGSPTGGNKGDGTLNAAGSVYVNNVALTCMILDPVFQKTGMIDLAAWDALVPTMVIPAQMIPARTERRPVMVATGRNVHSIEDRGGKLTQVVVPEMVQATALQDVYAEDGVTVVSQVEVPQFEDVVLEPEKVIPEQVTPGVHTVAHWLSDRITQDGWKPLDRDWWIGYLRDNGAVPGMPTKAEWTTRGHNDIPIDELVNRAWLAKDMLAYHMGALMDDHAALVARVAALEKPAATPPTTTPPAPAKQ